MGKRAFGDACVSGIGSSPTAALISFHLAGRCVDIAHSCPSLTHPGLLHRCFHCTSEDRDILKVCDLFFTIDFFSHASLRGESSQVGRARDLCTQKKETARDNCKHSGSNAISSTTDSGVGTLLPLNSCQPFGSYSHLVTISCWML